MTDKMNEVIDWDNVPDEDLEETLLERFEGLKEMFPQRLRSGFLHSIDWTKWFAVKSVSSTLKNLAFGIFRAAKSEFSNF